ncbi:MAG: hypothetical protein HGGPFJEG_01169 [Ignavibacteria bacterium]|nr:hypothetical protein [Ignavibacteria bacterium]
MKKTAGKRFVYDLMLFREIEMELRNTKTPGKIEFCESKKRNVKSKKTKKAISKKF